MKDATAMSLPLVGGDIHDWNWIFTQLGILKEDQIVGGITFALGALCLVIGIGLCIYFTWREVNSKPTSKNMDISV